MRRPCLQRLGGGTHLEAAMLFLSRSEQLLAAITVLLWLLLLALLVVHPESGLF